MRIRKRKLGSKIFMFLALIVFILIAFYTVIYTQLNRKYEEELLGQESIKTLYSLETSINTIIQNADDYSKMLIADVVVQTQMESGDLLADPSKQQQLINHIYGLLQFSDSADAIWLIDQKNHKFRVGEITSTSIGNDMNLYEEMRVPYGRASVIFENIGKSSIIALVRSYNSLSDFSSLGMMGVEISGKRMNSIIREIIDANSEQLYVVSENGQILFEANPENDVRYLEQIRKMNLLEDQKKGFRKVRIDKKEYLLTGIVCSERNWKIYRLSPVPAKLQNSQIVRLNLFLIVTVGIFILVGTTLITGLLTKPIQKMVDVMEHVEKGVPEKIYYRPFMEEFRMLFRGYNRMVERIEQLIQETIERQKRIRQVELNEIQEQMKPHFLYNTLDSIEALALMGDTQTVCKLIEALGGFYRKSVSGGREFLTIKEEFEMTRDYAKIMNIRFGETFQSRIDCDEECSNFLIPKLTVQPLVENAFQHGIRGKVTFGIIEVRAVREGDEIHISISDNGDGIPEEVIRELSEQKDMGKQGSLGLRGTIKRLRLIYGKDFWYEIGRTSTSQIDLHISVNALKEQQDEKI